MTKVPKKTGYIKSFDGTKIYYESRGEGPPIILVYGIGCLINHWRFQIRHFSKNYQTIVFDIRAHHKSEIPQDLDKIGIDIIAQDIKALTEELGIQKASFWGHSFGVQVLLKTYDLYPELVDNFVFINGFANDPISPMFGNGISSKLFHIVKTMHEALPETSAYLWEKLINNPLATYLSGLAGGFNLNLTQLKDIEIYARGVGSLDLTTYISLFEKMIEYDGRDVFEKISIPTLIISGQKDSVTPVSYQEDMHRRIKHSQFISVPYGSHCTQLDMPEFVNLAAEKFLTNNNYS